MAESCNCELGASENGKIALWPWGARSPKCAFPSNFAWPANLDIEHRQLPGEAAEAVEGAKFETLAVLRESSTLASRVCGHLVSKFTTGDRQTLG